MHAIPHAAIKRGLLTVEKQGKKNVFSGRILEIEGLGHLKCEQAFELSDASAERSAAGCTIKLDRWATPRAASAAQPSSSPALPSPQPASFDRGKDGGREATAWHSCGMLALACTGCWLSSR